MRPYKRWTNKWRTNTMKKQFEWNLKDNKFDDMVSYVIVHSFNFFSMIEKVYLKMDKGSIYFGLFQRNYIIFFIIFFFILYRIEEFFHHKYLSNRTCSCIGWVSQWLVFRLHILWIIDFKRVLFLNTKNDFFYFAYNQLRIFSFFCFILSNVI